MIMIAMQQLDAMRSVDISVIDINTLADVRDIQFDNVLSGPERVAEIVEKTKNPYCFRYGDLGVQVEFTDGGPALGELLTDFLLRKKSGL